jgi:uncharacterized protein
MSEANAVLAAVSGRSSRSRKPPRPEPAARDSGLLFDVETTAAGRRLIARRDISAGTILFGENDWADDAERRAFVTLSEDELDAVPVERRATFTCYGYNTARHEITGTFALEAARHPTNFANHSCDPNSGYNGADHIVALRAIKAGDEIVMDYGTFSFSFDHAFTCGCGTAKCRGKVTRSDWPALVRGGLRLPAFMKDEAARVA